MSKVTVTIDNQTFEMELEPGQPDQAAYSVLVNSQPVSVYLPAGNLPLPAIEWMVVDDRPYEISFAPDLQWLQSQHSLHQLDIRDLDAPLGHPRQGGGDGRIKAPIPGLVIQLFVATGDHVTTGQSLLILEAMKMENEIRAPWGGTIQAIHVAAGQSVRRDELLVEIGR